MLKTLSFRTKLLLLVGFLCVISVSVGTIGYLGLTEVEGHYSFITDKSVPKMNLASQMFLQYRRVRINLRTLGLPGLTEKDAQEAIAGAQDAIAKFEEDKKQYLELGFVPGQREKWEKVDEAWAAFKDTGARAIAHHRSGKAEDRAKLMDIFFHECPERAKVFTEAGEDLEKFHNDVVHTRVKNAKSASLHAVQTMTVAVILGLVLGISFGMIFSSAIAKTLRQIADRLAAGADEVASASGQLSASSQELSAAAAEQAASLEQTAASIEEMNSMVTKTSENASQTATTSESSKSRAEEGRAVVETMIRSMDEINSSNQNIVQQINHSNNQIAEIVKVIQEIGNKTKVINDIVFQTKLLSFNASVEAARAGEHGKGFAVVAEEVGNLAQMSGNAAKEISEMLDGSIQKVEGIVAETKTKVEQLIDEGRRKVETGSNVARQCGEVLSQIVSDINSVSSMAGEISTASREQAQGVQEITKAMGQLDQVTQQNASASEQVASATEELSAQAQGLKGAASLLLATVQGGNPAALTAHPPAPAVHSERSQGKKKARPSKVVHMSEHQAKKASAGDTVKDKGGVPSFDHPGFKEV